jgi:hypothetical protein
MQKRICLGKRTVYKSEAPLLGVQRKLIPLLAPLLDALPGNEAALAYRKGVTAMDVIKRHTESAMLITCDIKGYYDHITLEHIEKALTRLGFSPAGGRLVGRYCIVRRQNHYTLQQGSPASPVVSNLVGYFCFDQPIQEWLREHLPEATYIRYSDNLALFAPNPISEELKDEYKDFVRRTCSLNGFRTHSWSSISSDHPKRNQRFLGIVLNHNARVEKRHIDRLRATFYSACRFGIAYCFSRYVGMHGLTLNYSSEFHSILKGHISYVSAVNKTHGLWLKKLYKAAIILDELEVSTEIRGSEPVRRALNTYKNASETVSEFTVTLRAAIDAVNAERSEELSRSIKMVTHAA